MIEELHMQEVSQIILSAPKGAIIPGKKYSVGEPIMIINNPSLSTLNFISKPCVSEDAQGHISTSGITKNIEFIINDGSVLYALWSYIYGYNDTHVSEYKIQGNEYLQLSEDGYIWLSAAPQELYFYKVGDNVNELINPKDYEVHEVDTEEGIKYGIKYTLAKATDNFLASYKYTVNPSVVSSIKQIHNNIFCSMDIYINAVDTKNDDKHLVYIHCDKVQLETNLIISVNDSSKVSFTPIQVKSVPEGNELNKDVATIVVI